MRRYPVGQRAHSVSRPHLASPCLHIVTRVLPLLAAIVLASCNVHPVFEDVETDGTLDERDPLALPGVEYSPDAASGPFPESDTVYDEGVELSVPVDEAEIYYTTDGSEPDPDDEDLDPVAPGETTEELNHDDGVTQLRAIADMEEEEAGPESSAEYVSAFELVFDPGEADEGTPDEQLAGFEDTVIVPDPEDEELGFENDDAMFFNWNTEEDPEDPDDGESYVPGDEFTIPDEDVTLYAQWDDSGTADIGVTPWEEDGIEITLTDGAGESFPESVELEDEGETVTVGAEVVSIDNGEEVTDAEWSWWLDGDEETGGSDSDVDDFDDIPADEIGTYLVSLRIIIEVEGQNKQYTKSREIEVLPEGFES